MWRVERISNLLLFNNFVKVKDMQATFLKPIRFFVGYDLIAFGDVNESIEYRVIEANERERCSIDFYNHLKKPMLMAKRVDLVAIYKLDGAYLVEYIPYSDEENSYKCVKILKHKDYGEVCNELMGYFYVKGFIKISDDDEVQYIVKNLTEQGYEIMLIA